MQKDTAAALHLAQCADRDASEFKLAQAQNTQVFNALRKTQLEHDTLLREHDTLLREHGKRLDQVEQKVDAGFERVERRFDLLRIRLDATDMAVDLQLDKIREGFGKMAVGQEEITQLLTRIIENK
ncbi:hypothetical protein EV192_102815 [Actinocrispum wychmicini]|uniref:Uncharacterized protein n=2 Tax=Actinocrispum wychmicini TaxID=1213861 RepID=A0A4R2JZ29_9PSEU|nr:hypothetical protein EV192_102815 [Actinocrispum wychmicini]